MKNVKYLQNKATLNFIEFQQRELIKSIVNKKASERTVEEDKAINCLNLDTEAFYKDLLKESIEESLEQMRFVVQWTPREISHELFNVIYSMEELLQNIDDVDVTKFFDRSKIETTAHIESKMFTGNFTGAFDSAQTNLVDLTEYRRAREEAAARSKPSKTQKVSGDDFDGGDIA